ncbi:MAG: diacylglycerol kinase family lipid kinase [Actinobacteria bacterium]|nr:diacylglycerol kinase family lipid kinase [Actinomycetota bacterium]
MKNLIILNPSSFSGKALAARQKLEDTLKQYNIDFTIHISKSSDDVTDTVRQNLDKFSNFISAGGDGTIHTIANVLAGTDRNLGCIPMGSGNDIAGNLGIPLNMEACCRLIRDCRTRRIDLGLINKKFYYLAVSGAGFDSVVNDLANNTKFPIKGPAKYTYAVYRTLITYRAKKFFIKYNGTSRTVEAMFCVAGNMTSYGGGMKIVPAADPSDGILDICIIKKMGKIHFIKTFPSVFEGKHTTDPFVEYFKTESFEIDSEYNFSVFADGEYICKLPAKYEIARSALNFIV